MSKSAAVTHLCATEADAFGGASSAALAKWITKPCSSHSAKLSTQDKHEQRLPEPCWSRKLEFPTQDITQNSLNPIGAQAGQTHKGLPDKVRQTLDCLVDRAALFVHSALTQKGWASQACSQVSEQEETGQCLASQPGKGCADV